MKKNNLMILIAGPYSSRARDSVQMKKHLKKMEEAALPIFRAGHIPIIGEWFAMPLFKAAGSRSVRDAVYDEIFFPISARIIRKCDAILRIEDGGSRADEDVLLAKVLGIPVYYKLEDILN